MPEYHSQWGEDRWIYEHVQLPAQGIFVEVGASDGRENSNTLFWEKRGWTGLCIEPDPRFHAALVQNRKCVIDHRAVSNRDADCLQFRQHDVPTWSGFAAQTGKTITVPTARLESVLDERRIGKIHILSLDTEGTELDVLRSVDLLAHMPDVLIIEFDTKGMEPIDNYVLWDVNQFPYRCWLKTQTNLVFLHVTAQVK